MRILTASQAADLEAPAQDGARFETTVIDEEAIKCGLRRIAPNSRTPTPDGTASEFRHLVFTLSGEATVTNGEEYEKVGPGSYALFEHGERPTYHTGDEELVVFEVAWPRSAAQAATEATATGAAVGHAPRPTQVYEEV